MKKYYKTIKTQSKNKIAEVYYRNATNKLLEKFLNKSIKEIEKQYTKNLASSSSVNATISTINKIKNLWIPTLLYNSNKIVLKWFKLAFKNQKSFTNNALKDFYKSITLSDIKDKKVLNTLKLVVQRNVGLIKNTTEQTIGNIENIVYNSMTNGQGWYDIEKSLNEQTKLSKERIKRIARDQTAKATEAINRIQQEDAGIDYFIWSSSKDERTSTGYGGHKQLDGKIYKYNETMPERLPIIDSYGHRGYPSDRVNCRCTSLAVILDDHCTIKWNKSKETYEVIKI